MDDLDVRLLVELLRDRIIPDRTLGQHFLLDEAVIDRAVEIASMNHPINEPVSYTHLTLPTTPYV